MTPEQEVALTHPCRLAGETVHRRFARRYRDRWSLVLTVNTGYE